MCYFYVDCKKSLSFQRSKKLLLRAKRVYIKGIYPVKINREPQELENSRAPIVVWGFHLWNSRERAGLLRRVV